MGFCDPHRTTNLTTYPLTLVGVVAWSIPSTAITCSSSAAVPPREASERDVSSIAFDSEFADGVRLVTSNVAHAALLARGAATSITSASPTSTNLTELYRLHRRRVARRAAKVTQKKITRGKHARAASRLRQASPPRSPQAPRALPLLASRTRRAALHHARRRVQRVAPRLSLAQHRPVVGAPARARRR